MRAGLLKLIIKQEALLNAPTKAWCLHDVIH